MYYLLRALYGLRDLPLFWQKELTKKLKELGFKPVSYEPYCFIKGLILLFFYVNDMVVAFPKEA